MRVDESSALSFTRAFSGYINELVHNGSTFEFGGVSGPTSSLPSFLLLLPFFLKFQFISQHIIKYFVHEYMKLVMHEVMTRTCENFICQHIIKYFVHEYGNLTIYEIMTSTCENLIFTST